LLQKTIIIGLGRPCAKSSSWGKSLGCQYYIAHGSTMYVEGSKVEDKLAIFRCPYCHLIICMSVIGKLFDT